jgi:hypothetical protein
MYKNDSLETLSWGRSIYQVELFILIYCYDRIDTDKDIWYSFKTEILVKVILCMAEQI